MKKQIEWVNIAKGIAIISVVLLHIRFAYPSGKLFPVGVLLGWLWHVPVFFLIAGFFIKEDKLLHPVSFAKGKMKHLYRLLLYFYIPAVLLHNVFLDIGFYDTTTDYHGKFLYYWDLFDFLKQIVMACLLAGREPILGAMWFVVVLFLALILFSVISFLLSTIIKSKRKYELIRGGVLFFLCAVSCLATNLFEFTIPRFSNTLTAIWLIYCGYVLKNYLKVDFTNKYIMFISLLCAYYIAVLLRGVSLNVNRYADVLTLTFGSIAVLYVICYFSRKIESYPMGRFLAFCGRESFNIMALHLIGYKLGTLFLNQFGLNLSLSSQMPQTNNSLIILIIYLLFGLLFPLLFMSLFRLIKNCRTSV